MSVPLSIVSTTLHMANAAGFVMLSPGRALSEYISASVLFSVFSWVCIWVLPSVWKYEEAGIRDLRSLQVVVALAGSAALLATHPNAMGLVFTVQLWLEVAVFMPYLMLFQSRSSLLIYADFVRALLNSSGLIVAILVFKGAPIAFASGLVISLGLVSSTLWLTDLYRAPPLHVQLRGGFLRRGFKAALSSLSFRQLLGARVIEVLATLLLNSIGALGPILALRAGSVAVQVAAFNARRLTMTHAIALGVGLYVAGMAAVFLIVGVAPGWAPATLHRIGLEATFIAFLPFLGMLILTVLSIQPGLPAVEAVE